jgi:hypothetical protein
MRVDLKSPLYDRSKKKVVTTRIELVKNNILTHEDLDCSLVNVIMLLKNMTIFF